MRCSAWTSGSTSGDDRDHPPAEVLTIDRRQSREDRFEFSRHLAMERGCCSPTGLSQSYMPCAPVAVHRRSLGQAAALDSVHEASERSLFHTEAPCEFCHSFGTLSQHAQQPGLNGRQVMARGDLRIEELHQAGKSDEPAGGVDRRIIRSVPSLRAVFHKATVHEEDS
jgi:hypothetical protein